MIIRSMPIKLYNIEQVIDELKLDDDIDTICAELTDTAILLGEPVGMFSEAGDYVITPRYFTMYTIYKTLNQEILN